MFLTIARVTTEAVCRIVCRVVLERNALLHIAGLEIWALASRLAQNSTATARTVLQE